MHTAHLFSLSASPLLALTFGGLVADLDTGKWGHKPSDNAIPASPSPPAWGSRAQAASRQGEPSPGELLLAMLLGGGSEEQVTLRRLSMGQQEFQA